MILSRRKFLIGGGLLLAAPAIIPYSNLMKVKQVVEGFNAYPADVDAIQFLFGTGNLESGTLRLRPVGEVVHLSLERASQWPTFEQIKSMNQ